MALHRMTEQRRNSQNFPPSPTIRRNIAPQGYAAINCDASFVSKLPLQKKTRLKKNGRRRDVRGLTQNKFPVVRPNGPLRNHLQIQHPVATSNYDSFRLVLETIGRRFAADFSLFHSRTLFLRSFLCFGWLSTEGAVEVELKTNE